jgi:SAM-dependent methyltransferase
MDASTAQAGARREARRIAATLPLYVGTIFLSAFLLFGIQPIFAKMVLPKLGGSPGVWSVAMVFFQTVLLAGYGYAHWLTSRFPQRRAALIHIAVMAAVLVAALPIGIAAGFERPPQSGQMLWLVALFGASVGLPFFAVAANGPLLQAWFARTGHDHAADPYFLYAASNLGSFLALIAYPIAVEPFLPLSLQASAWAWGFGLLLAGVAACAGLCRQDLSIQREATAAPAPITLERKLVWALFAFVPSGLLVSVTAHISTDVAAAPLLWIAPLALFLLTFVIVFQRKPWLRHDWMLKTQLLLGVALVACLGLQPNFGWGFQLALHLCVFFVTAMVAHGELAQRRPDPANLTQFYLWMSVGGVLGGLFSGLLAPALFNSVVEYPMLLVAGLLCRPGFRSLKLSGRRGYTLAALALVAFSGLMVHETTRVDMVRSFFGVHHIRETQGGRFRLLVHGTTMHGAQRLLNDDGTPVTGPPEPLTYYFSGGGIADGIASVRQARAGRLDTVAIVGVGTGSLACHKRSGEDWRFYEIDPHVVAIATDPARFSFMSTCAPDAVFVMGDARLTLADAGDATLDLIVVDAFSSDAIPVHLLTSEAIALYGRKLKPTGVVLLHISNRNMELGSVVTATAHANGMQTWIRAAQPTAERLAEIKVDPRVAVIARQEADVGPLAETGSLWVRQVGPGPTQPWRDDFADVLSAIWRRLARGER